MDNVFLLLKDANGVLHRGAVEGAVLTDEDAAVDGDDVVFREGFLELMTGKVIVNGLSVGGHENGAIDDEEVGVGGREAVAVIGVVDGRWKGERDEMKKNL